MANPLYAHTMQVFHHACIIYNWMTALSSDAVLLRLHCMSHAIYILPWLHIILTQQCRLLIHL
jgi:hypothetical protein